ncbi:hypothetical protein L7F22_017658 [Adiantum nelumboides]|nr:hypothetical protein [Adiantum nelumboides]
MKGKMYILSVDFSESGSLSAEQCKALEAIPPSKPSSQLTKMEPELCEETILLERGLLDKYVSIGSALKVMYCKCEVRVKMNSFAGIALLALCFVMGVVLSCMGVQSFFGSNGAEEIYFVESAGQKRAGCLVGNSPAYHLRKGMDIEKPKDWLDGEPEKDDDPEKGKSEDWVDEEDAEMDATSGYAQPEKDEGEVLIALEKGQMAVIAPGDFREKQLKSTKVREDCWKDEKKKLIMDLYGLHDIAKLKRAREQEMEMKPSAGKDGAKTLINASNAGLMDLETSQSMQHLETIITSTGEADVEAEASEEAGTWAKWVVGNWEMSERVNMIEDLTKVQARTKSVEAKRLVVTKKDEMKMLWEHVKEQQKMPENEQLRNRASQSLNLNRLMERIKDRKTVEAQMSYESKEQLPGLLLGARVCAFGYTMKFIYLIIYLGLTIIEFGWSAEKKTLMNYRVGLKKFRKLGKRGGMAMSLSASCIHGLFFGAWVGLLMGFASDHVSMEGIGYGWNQLREKIRGNANSIRMQRYRMEQDYVKKVDALLKAGEIEKSQELCERVTLWGKVWVIKEEERHALLSQEQALQAEDRKDANRHLDKALACKARIEKRLKICETKLESLHAT